MNNTYMYRMLNDAKECNQEEWIIVTYESMKIIPFSNWDTKKNEINFFFHSRISSNLGKNKNFTKRLKTLMKRAAKMILMRVIAKVERVIYWVMNILPLCNCHELIFYKPSWIQARIIFLGPQKFKTSHFFQKN